MAREAEAAEFCQSLKGGRVAKGGKRFGAAAIARMIAA